MSRTVCSSVKSHVPRSEPGKSRKTFDPPGGPSPWAFPVREVLGDDTLPYVALGDVTSCYMTLSYITSWYITLRYITLPYQVYVITYDAASPLRAPACSLLPPRREAEAGGRRGGPARRPPDMHWDHTGHLARTKVLTRFAPMPAKFRGLSLFTQRRQLEKLNAGRHFAHTPQNLWTSRSQTLVLPQYPLANMFALLISTLRYQFAIIFASSLGHAMGSSRAA